MFKPLNSRIIGTIAAIAALTSPAAASAIQIEEPGAPPQPVRVASPAAAQPPISTAGPSSQAGFQWGDAGIGAAGAVVLLGGGVAAAGTARRRRTYRNAIS